LAGYQSPSSNSGSVQARIIVGRNTRSCVPRSGLMADEEDVRRIALSLPEAIQNPKGFGFSV
jgi:hypothetical protein